MDKLNDATVAEIRKGWKGHASDILTSPLFKVLDLDLEKVWELEILK